MKIFSIIIEQTLSSKEAIDKSFNLLEKYFFHVDILSFFLKLETNY